MSQLNIVVTYSAGSVKISNPASPQVIQLGTLSAATQAQLTSIQSSYNAIANGTSTDAGTLTGTETLPMSRGAGLLQATLTKIAQWAIQTYKGFVQSGAGAVAQSISAKAANRIDLSDFLPTGAISDYGQYVNAAISVANVSGVTTVINLPSTTMPLTTAISMGRNVILRGGPNSAFSWNGAGPAIYYHPTGSFNPGRHALENFDILGGSAAGAAGVEISDTFGFRLTNIGISGFTAGDGLTFRNMSYWTEGTVLENVRIGNNLRNWVLKRDPAPATATDSFGYTRALNMSIQTNDGQRGIVIGDDAYNIALHTLYNAILNVNMWINGAGVGLTFGQKSVIRDCVGMMGGEIGAGFSGVWVPPNTNTSGLFTSDLVLRSSPLSGAETPQSIYRDLRVRKFRDIGEKRTGQGTTPQWFKVALLGATWGSFMGSVTTQSQYGRASFDTATATFMFGVNGNGTGGFVPVFSVAGSTFSNAIADNYNARFVIAYDGASYFLYFRRPSFCNVCVFDYSYDTSNGDTFELWTPDVDPTSNGLLTVKYDSFSNAAQPMYNGDEQVCTGQFVTFATNGGTTVYNVPHSLGAVPGYYNASALSAAALTTGIASVTADSTNIIITMKATTPTGTGNITFAVDWRRNSYQKRFRT